MPLGQVLLRGGAAGAASSGINYLSDSLDTRKIREDALRRMAQGTVSPYARRSDLSGLCSVPDPFASGVGYPAVRGYRYEGHPAAGTAGKGGFNLADFGKELLTGFVAGGLSSAAFYGAGKAVEAVKGSVRSAGKGGSEIYYRTMSQGDYDYLRMTGELPSTGETFISPTKSFSRNYDGIMIQLKVNKGTTKLLTEIGVSNNTSQSIRDFGRLPQVQSGWNINNVFFKGEGTQTNIGLGQGRGLEIFNRNLIEYIEAGGK